MSASLLPYVTPLLLSGLLSLAVVVVGRSQRDQPGIRWFLAFESAIAVWSLGYAGEVMLVGREAMIWTAKVQYLGIPFVPVAWFLFAVEYAGLTWWRRRWTWWALVPSALTTVFAWTNEAHGLIYRSVGVRATRSFTVLDLDFGVWFWVNVVESYVALLLATGIIVRVIRVRPPLFRRQAVLLFIGSILPWSGNVLYITGTSPGGLDLTVFGFAASGLLVGWAMLRWRFLSVGPIGRETVVDGLAEPVAVLDIEGRIVDVNPALTTVLGVPGKELVGSAAAESLATVVTTLDADRVVETMIDLDVGGDACRFEARTSPLVDARGNFRGWTLVMYDVTRRAEEARALEQARLAAERTADAQRAFMRNMNHELRTPLNGVLGMLEVLGHSPLDGRSRTYLEQARASGEHLLDLLSRLLDFASVEAGSMELKDTDFNVVEVVRGTMEQSAPAAAAKKTELSFAVAAGVPRRVCGDPEVLSKVIASLVTNAVKFTEYGDVTVTLSRAADDPADEHPTDDRSTDDHPTDDGVDPAGDRSDDPGHPAIRIEVRDTGIGIPADRLGAIFMDFVQADDSPTRRHEGAGIGLSAARRMVSLMGGTLQVRSEVGRGSTFWFDVPLRASVRGAARAG